MNEFSRRNACLLPYHRPKDVAFIGKCARTSNSGLEAIDQLLNEPRLFQKGDATFER